MHAFENHRWAIQIHPLCRKFNTSVRQSAYENHTRETQVQSSRRYLWASPCFQASKIRTFNVISFSTNIPRIFKRRRYSNTLLTKMRHPQGPRRTIRHLTTTAGSTAAPRPRGRKSRSSLSGLNSYWGSTQHLSVFFLLEHSHMEGKVRNTRTFMCTPRLLKEPRKPHLSSTREETKQHRNTEQHRACTYHWRDTHGGVRDSRLWHITGGF